MSQQTNQSTRSLLDVANHVARQLADLKSRGRAMSHAELLDLWAGRNRSFWILTPEIYEVLADRFLRIGDLFFAVDCAREGIAQCGERPQLIYQAALALARLGARTQAERMLMEHARALAVLPDFRPLIARLHKDAWKATHDRAALRKARDEYGAAAEEARADVYYPAVNAATLSLLLDEVEEAARFGKMVRDDLAGREPMNYWEYASLAEAELAAGKIEDARAAYRAAVGCEPSTDQLSSTRDQASLLLENLGYGAGELADVLGTTNIVCFTGHMIDRPGRATARFPESNAARVKQRMGNLLHRLKPTAAVCAPAAGADLLAAESMIAVGIAPCVILPIRQESFKAASVTPSGGDWGDRYDEVLSKRERVLESPADEPDEAGRIWAFGNDLILGHARQLALAARGSWEVIAVWDGKGGDGQGGTHDFVRRAGVLGAKIWVIDPMDPLPAAEWKSDEGPVCHEPSWTWVVHVHAASREGLIKCLDDSLVSSCIAQAHARVELGGQARLVFEDYRKCVDFLVAMMGHAAAGCGIGVAVGAGYDVSDYDPGFFEDAAALATASLPMQTILATWECAAIAALHEDDVVTFDFAGRREFPVKRFMPFYTVASTELLFPVLQSSPRCLALD